MPHEHYDCFIGVIDCFIRVIDCSIRVFCNFLMGGPGSTIKNNEKAMLRGQM